MLKVVSEFNLKQCFLLVISKFYLSKVGTELPALESQGCPTTILRGARLVCALCTILAGVATKPCGV